MTANLQDNHYKGIIFMLLSSLSFTINDTIIKDTVKKAGSDFALFNIIFIRGIFTCIIILIAISIFGKINFNNLLKNKRSIIRGIFEVLTAMCFLSGLMLMPIADAYTLLNTAPLIITALGAFFLKEKVGLKRWAAVILGFIGVLIVINPISIKFNYFFILPVMAAFFLTMRDIVTRGYNDSSTNLEIIFTTALLVTISFGFISIFFPFNFDYKNLATIFYSSIFLTLGYFFSVLTIIYAPVSLTSSFRYSVIIFGIIAGYVFLNEIPTLNIYIGAVIISISCLFVIKRQKDLGKIK